MESVLTRAREQEREYNWSRAAHSYDEALGLVSNQDVSKMGELHERRGYASYRAALQAENVEEFRERIRNGIAAYEKARGLYEQTGEHRTAARALRCRAIISYLQYWLAPTVTEKKKLLDETWRLTKESLKKFEEDLDARAYGATYNQLSTSAILRYNFQRDFETAEKILREGLEHGERAIKFLSTIEDPDELAKAYVNTAGMAGWIGYEFLADPDEQDKYSQRALGYWTTAKELSEEAALLQSPLAGLLACPVLGAGTEEVITIEKKTLEYGTKARDRLIVGLALELLAIDTFWKALGIEDPDEQKSLLQEAVQYAVQAKNQYSPITFTSPGTPILWAEAPYAEYYMELARLETEPRKKHDSLEKSQDAASDHLKLGEDSGHPMAIETGHHTLSKALVLLAQSEARTETKKSLLERALEHRIESNKIGTRAWPYAYWDLGVGQNYLANIRSELAHLAEDPDDKKKLLREAILTKETCLKLCNKVMPRAEKTGSVSQFAWLGERWFEYGDLWNSLYELSHDSEHLKKATEAFEQAAQLFQKPNLASRVAECFWKTGRAFDILEDHLKAAESFIAASNNYSIAAGKIPQLKSFYQDHTSYLQAWSQIEKAKHHHRRQEYGQSHEYYRQAANLHKPLKQWDFLVPNYSAWAQVEKAEDLSRNESSEESIQAFQEAARLFREGKTTIEAQLGRIENLDEKQMAAKLAKAADLRREYCNGRIALEEAKTLDKKGDHYSSSEKYGEATGIFEKISQRLESDQSRQEFRLITTLARAWQTMTRAEAEASPELYLEASKLFEEAKQLSPGEKSKMLALGHSRFCKALEEGARFADTRDASYHTAAIQNLESAANFYVKAGFQLASEYAKASKLLFDAYAYMDQANKEADHVRKAKLYVMTEKVLQASADSFAKAQYAGKREEVTGLLQKVREERELAVSLSEVLQAPSIISTTSAFNTPTPTFERAVGLDRFEHAAVQASLITAQKELKVGEDLDLEIELVNAGRGPAQLVKLEEVIPEGFELTEKPELYRVEGSYLNMKGKQLNPLKTEEIKLVLRPKIQGHFTLKPRILYLDENGTYRSHEPEALGITVKELGISGWLKGRQ